MTRSGRREEETIDEGEQRSSKPDVLPALAEALRKAELIADARRDAALEDELPGSPLTVILKDRRLPENEVLVLFESICAEIHRRHVRGVVHGNLTPGRIRVDDGGMAQVFGFGVVATTANEPSTSRGDRSHPAVPQTEMPWAPPERLSGARQSPDTRADVYSLGVLLYHALTGRFPYYVHGENADIAENIAISAPRRPRRHNRRITRDLEAVLLMCLEKEPADRYQTAGELGQDLRRARLRAPVAARLDERHYAFRSTARRYWPLLLAMVAVVSIVAWGVS